MSQTFSFELDMDKSRRSPQMVAARVGDMGSIHINANLVLNGAAYTPTGQNAYFECITNAGTSVRVQAQKSGSTVSVDIPSQALCKPGVITCAYFRFENGTTENPTFVESTQSFGIIVPTSIDDNIDAEDYLGEWRALEQQLQGYVDEVSAAATQAKKDISSDTSAVESAKSSAISSINADKQEVADAAADVMKPINDALDQFNKDSQGAIDSFNSKGTSAISAFNSSSANAVSQFNTNGTNAVNSFNTKGNQAVSTFNANGTQKIQEFDDAADTKLASVDKMISQAQSDVDADIAALQKATQDAIDAMEAALSEDQYGEILQRLNRVWKLSHLDMTAITNGQDLNSFKSVGCYVCQTNAAAQTLQNKPEDLSVAFFLYVLSISSTGSSQYYTQLIIPFKPVAGKMKLYCRMFDLAQNTWDEWAEVGSGADITAGDGIIVTGDDTKQVALDPDAFHESIEGAELASFDTSVTGGGSVQEMVVYGNTVQNLWVNPSGTRSGVTVTANADGSITLSGTPTSSLWIYLSNIFILRPGSTYTFSIDGSVSNGNAGFYIDIRSSANVNIMSYYIGGGQDTSGNQATFTVPGNAASAYFGFGVNGVSASVEPGTYRVMLNEGSTAEPWCPPGLNSVDTLVNYIVGKNIAMFVDVGESAEVNGVNWKKNDDGSFRVWGKNKLNSVFAIVKASYRYGIEPMFSSLFASDDLPPKITAHLRGGRDKLYLQMNCINPMTGSNFSLVSTRGSAGVATASTVRGGSRFSMFIGVEADFDDDVVIYPQIEFGDTATDFEKPFANYTPIDLQGHTLNALPDGTRDELHIDGGGNVVLEKRCGVDVAPTSAGEWGWQGDGLERGRFNLSGDSGPSTTDQTPYLLCDKLPIRKSSNQTAYAIVTYKLGLAKAESITDVNTAASVAGGAKYIYKLAEPQTIDLGKISLSSVSSSQLNVWVDGSPDGTNFTLPVTIDVVANKVDYRLSQPVDLSSKEDAFDVLPVSKGGTGTTSAQAERNRLGLGNTTGALPVANGGTGATSASNAANAILGGITGSTNTLGSTAEFFIDDGGVPSRLGYLTLVSDISARLLGNSESNAKVKFLTVENVGGTLAGVASNIYDFINDCDNDGDEFLCLAKFTATIAGQSFNVGLVGRLEKDLSNGGPTIYMSGIGWPTSVDSVSDNGAGLLLVHAFTKVTRTSMSFNASSLYFLGVKVMTTIDSWPPPSSYSVYGARYNSSNFSFNRMLLFGYDSKMVV